MRAMILAAGRGKRMGSLTDSLPKPLLKVGDHFLIEYNLWALAKAGFKEIVINISYYHDLIKKTLGDGKRYGVTITYSEEETALETGGGIYQALPYLGRDPFLVVSGDIITDFHFPELTLKDNQLAHLVLVPNPDYHPKGDFGLQNQFVTFNSEPYFTFSNIGLYHPDLFKNCQPGYFRLGDLLKKMIANNQVTGELFNGLWFNIGTSEELRKAESLISVIS